jgi:Kef-type K+ transport system membrane component KefB
VSNILLIIAAMVLIPWLFLKLTKLDKHIPLPMAQIAFGICFGPSAFGSSWPELWSSIFTQQIKTGLDSIQVLAISIFSFIAGLELKPKEILEREGNGVFKQAFHVVLVPIVLSAVCFLLFFDNSLWHNPNVEFWKFAWVMGVATCITAVPMLVVSCKNLGIHGSYTYNKLLGLVIFDDLLLWLTVALFVSLGQTAINSLIFFSVVMLLWYTWPKILNLVDEAAWPTLTVAFALAMASFSYWAGLHYVLGAFLAGMVTPKKAMKWNEGMDFQQMYWLMPVFFIWTGLKVNWAADFKVILAAAVGMLMIAIATKFVGVWLAYRTQGIRVVMLKTSLLQTKGLMEIFLVTMLFSAGIVSSNMFAAVVFMSLISTVIAVPLARLFYKPEIDNNNG